MNLSQYTTHGINSNKLIPEYAFAGAAVIRKISFTEYYPFQAMMGEIRKP